MYDVTEEEFSKMTQEEKEQHCLWCWEHTYCNCNTCILEKEKKLLQNNK
jgi:hypothetical protein